MDFIKPKTYNLKPITCQDGIATMEILLAMVILTLALTAVILVLFGGQSVTTDAQTNQEALYIAQEDIEDVRSQSRGSVSDFNSITSTPVTSEDIYDKQILVSDISQCTKRVTSNVNWDLEQRPQAVSLATILTSVDAVIEVGGFCGPDSEPVSEWWYPNTFVSVDLKDFGGPNNGTSATSIDLINRDGNKYVVLGTKHSTTGTHDVWIFDVTSCVFDDDPANCIPTLAGSGNASNTSDGLNDIDSISNFAFAANNENQGQFFAVDLSDLSDPVVAASTSLPGVDSNGSYPQGRKVFYFNDRVYVGINETAGSEFHVYDVSDPANPAHLGELELTHNVHDIIVRGDYAYLATSDNSGEVMVIDISDPSSMIHPDISGMKFNAPGNYDGNALYLLGSKLYLGRDGNYNDPDIHNFFILDISNPASITSLGSKYIRRNPNISLGILTLVVSGKFAFMGTDDSNAEFQVFVVDNPADIRNCSEPGYPGGFVGCGKYDFPAKITDIKLHENLIYTAIESNDAFRIIFDNLICYEDPSDPSCN